MYQVFNLDAPFARNSVDQFWKLYNLHGILLIAEFKPKGTIRIEVEPLAKKYDVSWIDVFGSYANGKATEKSDIDILIKFVAPIPSIFAVMGFREELARKLKIPVDLISLPLSSPEKLNIHKTIRLYEK